MGSQSARLLDTRKLNPNDICPREQVLDLGAYRFLVIDPRILTTGQGNLFIETAAINDEQAWRIIATIPLTAVSNMIEIATFLRFVRWRTDNNVTGTPTVVVDVIAKS